MRIFELEEWGGIAGDVNGTVFVAFGLPEMQELLEDALAHSIQTSCSM